MYEIPFVIEENYNFRLASVILFFLEAGIFCVVILILRIFQQKSIIIFYLACLLLIIH